MDPWFANLAKGADDLFLSIIWIFTEDEGDGIKSRLLFKTFSTLPNIDLGLLFLSNFSTQEVTAVQKRIGQALGLPFHKVIVKNKRAGGAFGGKERMHLALIASVSSVEDIQIKLRLFLFMAMYCQASSSQFFFSITQPLTAGKEA